MDPIRLRRPLVARLAATTAQGFLTVVTVLFAFEVYLIVTAGSLGYWLLLVLHLLLVLLWARGASAWARLDESGVHWRYWTRHDLRWSELHKVTLTRRASLRWSDGAGSVPIILVHRGGGEDIVQPAVGCGRRRREFATALLRQAAEHGVRTEVVSKGWAEQPERIAEPYE